MIKSIIKYFLKISFEFLRWLHLFWYRLRLLTLTKSKKKLKFVCNICGYTNEDYTIKVFDREVATCKKCNSNLRTRSLVEVLLTRLGRGSQVLCNIPKDSLSVGLGMSDSLCYSKIMAQKFSYTNTYFHKKPFFDITSIPVDYFERYDFIISSEVLEHIKTPVINGVKNLYNLLKPGGILILTVPFMNFACTWEHYPNLHEYKIIKENGEYVLYNITVDGKEEIFKKLNFHGGPGETLEMRIFTKSSLLRNLKEAGFNDIKFHSQENLQYGIKWLVNWSCPISAVK